MSVVEVLKICMRNAERYNADMDVYQRVMVGWENISPKEMQHLCTGSCCFVWIRALAIRQALVSKLLSPGDNYFPTE